MKTFQECLICDQNSKKQISNKPNSQIRAIFILRELLDISQSTCVDLLQSQGTHPSSWFSCCWECSKNITEAVKIDLKLRKLKFKLKKVKISLKKKLQNCHLGELGINVNAETLEKSEIAIKTIRDEALCRIAEDFDALPNIKIENVDSSQLLDVKTETPENDFCNVDCEFDDYSGTSYENNIQDANNTLPADTSVQRTSCNRLIKGKNIDADTIPFDLGKSRPLVKTKDEGLRLPLRNKTKRKSSNTTDSGENGISSAEEEQSEYECQHCSNVYNDLNRKKSHENRSHGENHTFRCRECSKRYPSIYTMYRHVKMVHKLDEAGIIKKDDGVKSYNCQKCNKSFISPKVLERHEKQRHKNSFHCQYCKGNFRSENSLKIHIFKDHGSGENPLQCKECGKCLQSKTNLEIHVKAVHLKEKDFVCEICSAAFSSIKYLQLHQLSVHEKSEQLQCKECGKILGEPASLRRHIENVHRGKYNFVCPICGVGKAYKSALDVHILTAHSDGPRPFPCTLCSKSYATRHLLNDHMRRHTGERPFKCEQCPSTFYEKRKLLRHVKGIHFKERRHECQTCHKKFPSQHYLTSHIYTTHNKKKSSLPPKQIVDKKQIEQILNSTPAEIQELRIDQAQNPRDP